jgi:hypothetical protein
LYDHKVYWNRSGVVSPYTPKAYLPEVLDNYVDPSQYFYLAANVIRAAGNESFRRILVMTDGTCGSACSGFLTQLRLLGRVLIVGKGGLPSTGLHESASFTGGNVEDWDPFVSYICFMSEEVARNTSILTLPSTAYTRFNFREFYLGNHTIPREFDPLPPDFHYLNWSFAEDAAIYYQQNQDDALNRGFFPDSSFFNYAYQILRNTSDADWNDKMKPLSALFPPWTMQNQTNRTQDAPPNDFPS